MKTWIFITSTFISFNVLGSCPQFEQTYNKCSTTSGRIIDSITTKTKPPFYRFSINSGGVISRHTVVTDGEPRDVTIQTQDGSEATLIERAHCEGNKLFVTRTSEESKDVEQRVYESEIDHMKLSYIFNDEITEIIKCHF